LHAVSVGEVLSALQLIHQLRLADPALPVFVSTTTLAGRAVADEKLRGLATGVFYAPFDYDFAIGRVLRRIRPAALVILETEIWPLLFRRAKLAGCGLLVIGGRISDRALPRYRRWSWFFRHALACPDAIFVQTERDRERYIDAGAPPEKVQVGGNLKYDAPLPPDPPQSVSAVLDAARSSAVWIAASTMGPARAGDIDEDDAVIAAFLELAARFPDLLLILAPRKPERFDVAAQKLRAAGIPTLRRSGLAPRAKLKTPGVLLLDSMGELASLFRFADIVFMAGTLADRGGHNILEPAAAGCATIIGPHMENFAAIADEFRRAGAVRVIEGAAELAGAAAELLSDSVRRSRMGAIARELALAKRGATARAVREILRVRDEAIPQWRGRGPAWPVMSLLARLWLAGNAVVQRQRSTAARALDAPVISIGGIGLGGAGKTPFAVFTAAMLRKQGLRPAILTRGYRRRSVARSVIVPAGAQASVDMTGDEAQILIQSGVADVGIGADRYRTGCALEARRAPDVFILDDGFQHRQLRREADIVLIDSMDPFCGGEVFPAGRLRQPLSALARASAFVITRAEPARQYSGIRSVLAHFNPAAPVFRSRVNPREWVDWETGQPVQLPSRPTVAFCGLGNPGSFWRTLAAMEVDVRWRWAFDDHHSYKASELRRLGARARRLGSGLLLTTQKDAANLRPDAARLVAPARILWLRIEAEVIEADEFLEFVRASALHPAARPR